MAARAYGAAYKARIAASKAHLDGELVNFARGIGHHGVADFIKATRQRCKTQITEDYARDILSRAGYPNPKR